MQFSESLEVIVVLGLHSLLVLFSFPSAAVCFLWFVCIVAYGQVVA